MLRFSHIPTHSLNLKEKKKVKRRQTRHSPTVWTTESPLIPLNGHKVQTLHHKHRHVPTASTPAICWEQHTRCNHHFNPLGSFSCTLRLISPHSLAIPTQSLPVTDPERVSFMLITKTWRWILCLKFNSSLAGLYHAIWGWTLTHTSNLFCLCLNVCDCDHSSGHTLSLLLLLLLSLLLRLLYTSTLVSL